MDLAGLLGLLRRQWILVGVIMLVALSSAFVTWSQAMPSYRATATLSVLPPRVNVEGVPRNPYLEIASASNADIAQRLSIQLNGAEWRKNLTAAGFSPDYLIDHGDATSPILRVNIETDEPELSEATLVAVIDGVREQLATQQERFEINQRSRFTIDVLDRPDGVTRLYGNRTRLTGAILVLGGIAAVVAAQALDNFQRRRQGERSAATTETVEVARVDQERPGVWIPRPNVEGRTRETATSTQAAPPGQTVPASGPARRSQILGEVPLEPGIGLRAKPADPSPNQGAKQPDLQTISETKNWTGISPSVTGEISMPPRQKPRGRE